MLRIILLSIVFSTQAMEIQLPKEAVGTWSSYIHYANTHDSLFIKDCGLDDTEIFEFLPAGCNEKTPISVFIVLLDLPSAIREKGILKNCKIFAQNYAINQQSKLIFLPLEIRDTVAIDELKDQGIKIANIVKSMADHKICIFGIGVGGCIAKSALRNLKYSERQIALFITLATPIVESRYADFEVSNTETSINIYSTADQTQISSVIFTTQRKIAEKTHDGITYNIRFQVNGQEASQDTMYQAIKKLAALVKQVMVYKIHTDLDVNCSLSDEIAHVVIRTEKGYKDLVNTEEACKEISMSNQSAGEYRKVYAKDVSEKPSTVSRAAANLWKVGLGLLGGK